MAAEQAIDLEQVSGSGERGGSPAAIWSAIWPTGPASGKLPAKPTSPDAAEQLEPLNSLRRAIARHMVQSKQTSPHATTINEVDMSAVVRHREAQRQGGQGVTYTAYFAAATVAGLLAVPAANSRFSEEGIWLQRQIHLGVAVAVPAGCWRR
jgi:pyruvate/2-oxoglutarate dehydrogenase complex dihydrolipoamide acyltransferase (E2) component